jgi:phage baseplate assembly protein W
VTAPQGPHLSFPFRISADGRTEQVQSLEEHVRDELVQLLLTNPGERPDLPAFGGGARRLVFDGAGATTAAMAKAMISQALTRWLLDRVTVDQLDVRADDVTLTVDLTYRVAGTEDQRKLTFQRGGG